MTGGVLVAVGVVGTGLAPTPDLAGLALSDAGAGNALDVIASDTLLQLRSAIGPTWWGCGA